MVPGVPADFDWTLYLILNPDVAKVGCTHEHAIRHWLSHGKNEQRKYLTVGVETFNWNFYVSKYPDLAHLKTPEEALRHYINYGQKEHRQGSFDWFTYVTFYQDLSILSTEELSIKHYLNYAMKEARLHPSQIVEKWKAELTQTPSQLSQLAEHYLTRLICIYGVDPKWVIDHVKSITASSPSWYQTISLSYLSYFMKLNEPLLHHERRFYVYLKLLHIMFPSINLFSYFIDFGPHGRNILTIPGIQLLLHLLHLNATVTEVNELTSILNNLTNSSVHEHVIFVRIPEEYHPAPLFVSRSNHDTLIIITDAAGKDGIKFLTRFQQAINRSILPNIKIVAFVPRRQYDICSCPISCLQDLIEHQSFNLVQYVQTLNAQTLSRWNNTNLYFAPAFPPRFMKIMQSLTALDDYYQRYPHWRDTKVSRKHLNGTIIEQNLQQVISSHTIIIDTGNGSGPHQVNHYLRQHAFYYFEQLIQHLLHNKQ
jgi:hypothetical protein